MDFCLSERELAVQKLFREFAEQEITPVVKQIERNHEITKGILKKLGNLNFFSLALPRDCGGEGESVLTSVLAVEELAKASAGLALVFIENIIAAQIMAYLCARPIRDRYLYPLIRGEILGGWGFSEPKGGSSAGAIETTAVLNGAHYILNGVKVFITGAPLLDIIIVYAKTGQGRLGAFIVEKNMGGFHFTQEEEMMGLHGAACGELVLQNVRVPQENLIGSEKDGIRILSFVTPEAKNYTGAVCLGLTQAVFDESLKYARQRKFQGAPLSQFHTVQKRIAKMAAQLQAGRWMIYWGAYLQQMGKLTNVEASMVKSYLSEIALESATESFRIHGVYGYTRKYNVERLYRDAIGLQVAMMANDTNDGIVGSALLDSVGHDVQTPVSIFESRHR